MPRDHQPRSATAPQLSGNLGGVLQEHAYERIRHFFLFIFTVKAACDRANSVDNLNVNPLACLSPKATAQIDVGIRDIGRDAFRDDDPLIIYRSAQDFANVDAAHFCNLGLTGAWSTIEASKDKIVNLIVEESKIFAGNTRQLPQRVNIGPDRVIDALHHALAVKIYSDGKAVVSHAYIEKYMKTAREQIILYRDKKIAKKKYGIAKCCDCYMDVYNDSVVDRLEPMLHEEILGYCKNYGLDWDDYIDDSTLNTPQSGKKRSAEAEAQVAAHYKKLKTV